ncbi:cytochrome C oxidase subunit IV family protein [Aliiglaciecola litoralis]|uniref:Cytochrome C oxidase subunit IV n=1 Tax=Aliiglaciecola litoralis TaxID=582857 RepID=A0ABN1LC25_9ALTE
MATDTKLLDKEQGHQAHPVSLYLKIWLLLFVLSGLSYAVDYMQLQGVLRWTLILLFMALKAGLIISVFMHMMWERMALICAILLPPLCLTIFIGLMAIESNYTFFSRLTFFTST